LAPPLLARAFFDRVSTDVAPDLLGCVLESGFGDSVVEVRVTEVEAYTGESDPASHAYRGRTARNAVMYGQAGHAYVYFTYGMHFCVNLVCQPPGVASAVLLRAGEVVAGRELAARRRLASRKPGAGTARVAERDLARGPGRLCQAMGIDRSLDGVDVCDLSSPVRIRAGLTGSAGVAAVRQGPRVGVSRAAEVPWRFWLDGDPSVSPYKAWTPKRRAVNRSAGP
jgi:DNA-3-methyladenine glycosylase